jgi:catechol 2,3-dioxygenase-like lactoylglutathione lyase family enzyme
MAFHHVAIATRDLDASHRFYTEAMGFELVQVDVIPFLETGWARHLFYDTGNGELIALWDLHDEDGALGDFDPAISTGLGLPNFVNHIAFGATDLDELDARKDRLVANGHDVARIDHGWCTSIYANDPSGIMVEFCTTTMVLGEENRKAALALLAQARPAVAKELPNVDFFEGLPAPDHAGVS